MDGMLRRELGVFGAVMMGLGSIVGTGVFVSIGIAAGITGPAVVLAVGVAAVVAALNGLSSAQLAANHPVSGGTYEYGYRYLTPSLGFVAGWVFLLAKSASAATAALGFAGYSAVLVGWDAGTAGRIGLGLGLLAAVVALVLVGIRTSNTANVLAVSITLAALAAFVVAGFTEFEPDRLRPFFAGARAGAPGFLEATALLFVAYTGYGRIATLGEEVRDPRVTIPRAIITTLVVTMSLYVLVSAAAVGASGAPALAEAVGGSAAPLEVAAAGFGIGGIDRVVAIGAVTAMAGVLINLVLGLSRVLLAMGRRGDVPRRFGRLDPTGSTPTAAVLAVGVIIAALVLVGDVKTTWEFSAFTVLVYYSITNLTALRIPRADRMFPKWMAAAGLVACAFLAFWVEPAVWLAGLAMVAVGLVWHAVARRRSAATPQ
jgi:APA family basic amino acid/polyamine antiporter